MSKCRHKYWLTECDYTHAPCVLPQRCEFQDSEIYCSKCADKIGSAWVMFDDDIYCHECFKKAGYGVVPQIQN